MLPKLSRRANTRAEFELDHDDGSYSSFIIDAYVKDSSSYGFNNFVNIEIVDVYKQSSYDPNKYEPLSPSFLESLTREQQDSINYLLEEEYASNMEMLEYNENFEAEGRDDKPYDPFGNEDWEYGDYLKD